MAGSTLASASISPYARHLKADGDVVARRLPGHQRVLLEEIARPPVEAGERRAHHQHLPAGGQQQPRGRVEQRGLAAPGGADNGDKLVRADAKIDGGNGRVAAAAGEDKRHRHAAKAHGIPAR